MINKFSILDGEKYVSLEIFQNYFKNILLALPGFNRGNRMKCQKKILKIYLNQTAILHQLWLIIIYNQTQSLMDTV